MDAKSRAFAAKNFDNSLFDFYFILWVIMQAIWIQRWILKSYEFSIRVRHFPLDFNISMFE